MDLNECRKKGFIKKTSSNTSKARSLLEVSDIKKRTVENALFDEENINAYLPLAYDSLRETLEAVCIVKGYNVTNHICLGELLKNIFPDFDFTSFDRFRYARNGINYYGKKIDLEQGKELIAKMFVMKNSMKKHLKEIMQKK